MIQDHITGVLLGLAAGDSHGGPIRMAVRLAESLGDCGGFCSDDVMSNYLGWHQEGAFDTGPVAGKVFTRVAGGELVKVAVCDVHEELGSMTAGCNPAHRCPPLAMSKSIADDALPDAAFKEAALTHFDSLAGDVSAAVVVLCRCLITGKAWSDSLGISQDGRAGLTKRALNVVDRASLDRGGYAPNVLAAAVHFLDSHNDLVGALDASFEFAGHWNFCPVLVGAIGGARWGINSVPLERVRHAEILPRVCLGAKRLAAAW